MAEKKKSIIEEALLDANKIQEALNANTKEILRSVAKEEIDGLVKESLKEDDYSEEEETDELPTDDVVAVDSEEGDSEADVDMDDMGAAVGDEEEEAEYTDDSAEVGMEPAMDAEPDMGSDMEMSDMGDEMDMTGASDDDVLAVYKKLTGEDEIEIVGDDIHLTVSEPGEYVVKGASTGAAPEADLGMDSMEEPEMADAIGGDEMGVELGDVEADAEMGDEMGAEPEMGDAEMGVEPEMDAEPEMGAEMGADVEAGEEEEDEYSELAESNVVYEIALDEDGEEVNEDKIRTATGDVTMGKGAAAPNTGDIEGQTSAKDTKTSGDNLSDPKWDDAQNGTGDAHASHIMSEDEEVNEDAETVTELETVEESDDIEETAKVGGRVKRVATSHTNSKLKKESTANKYNKVLAEAKNLQVKNGEYKKALKQFRTMLAETVVWNTNLTYVTKLMVEHSTTKDEKREIMSRFDEEVSTIKESKMLYKTIDKELAKKTISESVDNKINKGATSSTSKQLNENAAYKDPSTARIMDLIGRVENR